jgi:AraC-like DNA-binding protein
MYPLPKQSDHMPVAGLAPYRLFHSKDLDETRSNVGRIFKPHVLGVCGKRQRLDAQMDHLAIGGVSLNRLRYGADVSIEPECLDDFLLVQMPIAGSARIQCGSRTIDSNPSIASVVTPSLPLHMRWQGQCDQLIVRIERSTLETACGIQLGHALPKPLEFDLAMDLRDGDGLAWHNLVLFLATSQFADNAARHPLVAAQIEQLLVSSLLLGQPHNYRDALLHNAPTPQPAYITRALDYIAEHCHQAITIGDIAAHAAISVRSLHAGFQQYHGTTPMAHLKLVRLQRVREELLRARAGNTQTSVTQVALNWGFSHFGHFSNAYRRQFNELPSQTLRG